MEMDMQKVVVMEEEEPWKTVKNKKKEKKKKFRPWDALPSLALLNIIRNLNFKDRLVSIPFVCKAWNSVISSDPRCWSSMVPESVSPDDAFIKKPEYCIQVDEPCKNRRVVRFIWEAPGIRLGVSHFRNLIKKSSLCSGSSTTTTITSLCLEPFYFSDNSNYESLDQDEILLLIAHCCPNLKHISFHGFYSASIEAVLKVFHTCKKIELIDFSDTRYADSQVIEELGNCLPHLRGIRMAGEQYYCIHDAIATHLPHIKLLAMECHSNDDEDWLKLTSETECCLYEFRYLGVGLYSHPWVQINPPVCTHVPEFHYEEFWHGDGRCDICDPPRRPVHRRRRTDGLCYYCHCAVAYAEADHWENLHFEEGYFSILEQKKEYEYCYVSILKEKKKKKKKKTLLRTRMKKNKKEASFILKMKMRKKRDKYDCQDFYVQAVL